MSGNRVENMTWDDLVDNYKLKDNGLLRAIREYSQLKAKEDYGGVLGELATIAKLGTDLKNSKEAKAAGPDVIKRMSKLIEGTVTSRKEWEKRKAEQAKKMTWDDLVDKFKLKDNGLLRAIRELSELKAKEEYDGVLAKLATIAKLGTDLKNSTEAKAAGPDVIERMSKLIEEIATSRKEWERRKGQQAKDGSRQDVQIKLEAWNGRSMYGGVATVDLSSAGGSTIRRKLSIGGTVLSIKDVYLKAEGMLDLSVYRGGDLFCEGTALFKLRPGKPVMQFSFVQDTKTVKVSAKNIKEVTDKLGLKAEAGLELKVLKVSGEVTKESEYKEGYEENVEWEIETGKEKFKESKQV